MIKRVILGVSILALLIAGKTWGQDIHFSQFNDSPQNLNPALTGLFNGDYRIIGNYRNQWGTIMNTAASTNAYRTMSANIDLGILKNRLGRDFMGIGASSYSDEAGQSNYGTKHVTLMVSYHKALTQGGTQMLSFGIKGGYADRSMNYSNLHFGNQYNGDKLVRSAPHNESFSRTNFSYFDLDAGVLWNGKINEKTNVYSGVALSHLTTPNQSHTDARKVKLRRKLTLHGGGQYQLKKRWSLLPSMMYLRQGKNQELNIGTYLQYTNEQLQKINTSVALGGWYRVSDALIPSIRLKYRNVSLGFSYDFNTSSVAKASNGREGPEISIIYIGAYPDKGLERPMKYNCPRF